MNEIQLYKMQEDESLGFALYQLLADMFGCEPNESAIKRAVYKYTDCGAWIHFTEKGVNIGSIVEGCDFDTESYDINYNGDDEVFKKEFWDKLDLIEKEADYLWNLSNKSSLWGKL